MNREERARQGEPAEDMVSSKWENLTRSERTTLSGARHSHQMKLYELYGISEEDAERALAAVDQDSHDLLPQEGPNDGHPGDMSGRTNREGSRIADPRARRTSVKGA